MITDVASKPLSIWQPRDLYSKFQLFWESWRKSSGGPAWVSFPFLHSSPVHCPSCSPTSATLTIFQFFWNAQIPPAMGSFHGPSICNVLAHPQPFGPGWPFSLFTPQIHHHPFNDLMNLMCSHVICFPRTYPIPSWCISQSTIVQLFVWLFLFLTYTSVLH